MEQLNTIISLLPQLETALAERGEKISRPDYGEAVASADAEMKGEDGNGEPAVKVKKNFEETSDEEE